MSYINRDDVPRAGRGRAMLALSLAILLPACSPADKEAEQANETASAADPNAPAVEVAAPADTAGR